MSLINYIEPVNIGSLFGGIGALIVSIVCAWIIYTFTKPVIDLIRVFHNREARYELFEEKVLNDVAKEKGIDLDAEMVKRDILRTKRKTFRRKVEEQIYEKMFGQEVTENKP